MNFLASHMCEIRFHDVIGQSAVHMYSYAKFQNMADLHKYVLDPYFFVIRRIQLCDKKNLTFFASCDKTFLNSS